MSQMQLHTTVSHWIEHLITLSDILGRVPDLQNPDGSRDSIIYQRNLPKVTDNTGQYIICKLSELGQCNSEYLQCILSHVWVHGIEIADNLAKKNCDSPVPNSIEVCPSEIHSLHIFVMNLSCRGPSTHHWYAAQIQACLCRGVLELTTSRPWSDFETSVSDA